MVALNDTCRSRRSRVSSALLLRENPPSSHIFFAPCSPSIQRARYYDPSTGEFTSRDPLEYVDGLSLYRAGFDIKGVDPVGLCTECEVGKRLVIIDEGPSLVFGSKNPDATSNGAFTITALVNLGVLIAPDRYATVEKLLEILKGDFQEDLDLLRTLNGNQRELLNVLTSGQVSVWTKAHCMECYESSFVRRLLGGGDTFWASGNSTWIRCQLANTDWAIRKIAEPGNVHMIEEFNLLLLEFLTWQDLAEIQDQCKKQIGCVY